MPVFIIKDFGTTERTAKKLGRGAAAAQVMEAPFAEIVADMMRTEIAVFASEGRRGGGSWKKLKEDTVRKKGNTELLRTRGAKPKYSRPGNDALFKSVTVPGAKFQIVRITNNIVEFGTDAPHADAMQHGAPSKNIPARPFFKFTVHDVERWHRIILGHLTRAVAVE